MWRAPSPGSSPRPGRSRRGKRFQEALRASRAASPAALLHLVPQAIFWKDEASVYLGCNRTFALAAGLTDPEQIVGKTDLDLPWNREEAEAYRSDDAQVIGSGIPKRHIVERQRQADGTELWIETNKVPMLDGTGRPKGVLGVFEDINERKQAEIALLESESRFREVLESSVDASYKRDLLADRYAYMSPVVERIAGYTSAEMAALSKTSWPCSTPRTGPGSRGSSPRLFRAAPALPSR